MLCSHQGFWEKGRSRQQAGARLGATCKEEWREAGVPGLNHIMVPIQWLPVQHPWPMSMERHAGSQQ